MIEGEQRVRAEQRSELLGTAICTCSHDPTYFIEYVPISVTWDSGIALNLDSTLHHVLNA